MASWNNDEDIARDLDILSGIKSPEGKVKSYISWGRGQNPLSDISDEIREFSGLQDTTSKEEFEWFSEKSSLEKFPDSVSRGKKLQILKENSSRDRELEVHEQLRAALGPGYSNAFIEESFKQRFKLVLENDRKNLPEKQFEDWEASLDHPPCSSNNLVDNCKSVDERISFMPASSELGMHPKDEISKEAEEKRKRKPRRYRNVLLESLEKMNDSENGMPVAHFNTDSVPIFGTKNTNIPPAGHLSGQNCSLSFGQGEKKSESSFEYKESEFPSL